MTLDVANRLRSLLTARDFDVQLTRDGDAVVTNDARAALANQSRAIACISLHATAAGKGLHLFTTSLTQSSPQGYAVPWDEAQSLYVERSQRLANELATAFGRSKIPVSSGRTWIRPLDNMQCPAVAVEIAPDGEGNTAADRGYENRIADTIAGAMLFWRGHTDVVQSILAPPPAVPETKPATAADHPETQTSPKVLSPRFGAPLVPGSTTVAPKPAKVPPATGQAVGSADGAKSMVAKPAIPGPPVGPKSGVAKPVAPRPPVVQPKPVAVPVPSGVPE